MENLRKRNIMLAASCFIMLALMTVVGCLDDDEPKTNKKIVYEIYRENADGTKTKWTTDKMPMPGGGHLSWTAPNGGTMIIFEKMTVIPVEVIIETPPKAVEDKAESREDKVEQK